MACDLIARTAFAPTELSISTVTSVFGAPVVIAMMMKRHRSDDKWLISTFRRRTFRRLHGKPLIRDISIGIGKGRDRDVDRPERLEQIHHSEKYCATAQNHRRYGSYRKNDLKSLSYRETAQKWRWC